MKLNPMSTAPKDGTPILVWANWSWSWVSDGSVARPLVCYWEDDEWDEDEGGYWLSTTYNPYQDTGYHPVGWLPIPYQYEVEIEV